MLSLGSRHREALSQELVSNPDCTLTSRGSQVSPNRTGPILDKGGESIWLRAVICAFPRVHSWSGGNWSEWGTPRNPQQAGPTMCLESQQSGS